jgi:hypothetical protein
LTALCDVLIRFRKLIAQIRQTLLLLELLRRAQPHHRCLLVQRIRPDLPVGLLDFQQAVELAALFRDLGLGSVLACISRLLAREIRKTTADKTTNKTHGSFHLWR